MALTASLPTGSPAGLSLIARRRIQAGLVARAAEGTPRTGVLPVDFGPLVTGKASMGYNVGEFVAVTARQLPGVEFVANDGTHDLSPVGYAAPTANSRLDVIWVRCRFTGFGDASDGPEIGITQGAASPTPVKPALPAGALELAVAEVKATDTTTQTVVITQTARYTAMAGGVVSLRSQAEQNAWNPADGAKAHRIDLNVPVRRQGGAWRFETAAVRVARAAAHSDQLPFRTNGGTFRLPWDVRTEDPFGFHSSAAPDRLTIPAGMGGVYTFTAKTEVQDNGADECRFFLDFNGVKLQYTETSIQSGAWKRGLIVGEIRMEPNEWIAFCVNKPGALANLNPPQSVLTLRWERP